MFRVRDICLMTTFSVSVVFVGAEGVSELPPASNLIFSWETPFTLYLTWEKPKDLDPDCKVYYTMIVHHSQNCSERAKYFQARKVQRLSIRLDIANENGLCISVTVNPGNCGNKHQSQPLDITIPPPPVKLNKPQLTIERVGQSLRFQTHVSYLEFKPHCYKFNYTYTMCDKRIQTMVTGDSNYEVDYDSKCMYSARVQIIFSDKCGAGNSDLSDEVNFCRTHTCQDFCID